MISKLHRFHGRNSLNNVYKYGKSLNSSNINLRYLLNSKNINIRVAVVVSRKVNKQAVKRNKIRRRVYEILRLNLNQIKPSASLILNIYSDDIRTIPYSELNEVIIKMLKKADLITPQKK